MTSKRRRPPPATPAEAETQLIGLAYDLAEKQLREGSASPTTINHFLKLGSTRTQYEVEKLQNENLLLAAKAESIESQARVEEKYDQVLEAIRRYTMADSEDADFED